MAGLTPLLDVIFLLLFALLISSETKTESDTELVPIQLPEVQPSEGSSETESQRLALTLDAESRVYVESATEALDSLDEVDAALASVLGDAVPEEVEIRIHADRDARHGVAIELLQHLRVRGFVQVQLVALGQPNPSGSFSSRPEARPSVNPTPEPATEDAR